jgi:SAM-dependent methyltransferase
MGQFKNHHESHEHSKKTLEILYGYDTFLDSLESVADFGCGYGMDTEWWAKLHTRDDPPEPRNLKTYAVDRDANRFNQNLNSLDNVYFLEADFDSQDVVLPITVDLIWCHDAFQYVTNPLNTLRLFNEQLNVNGMLVLILPQLIHSEYNKINNLGWHLCYHNYNLVNLMYMLAVNGFDCKDAYFTKEPNDPWLYIAVYKSDMAPMNPKTTTWYDLADANLLNASVVDCLNRYGYVRQEEIVTTWLNKDFVIPKE